MKKPLGDNNKHKFNNSVYRFIVRYPLAEPRLFFTQHYIRCVIVIVLRLRAPPGSQQGCARVAAANAAKDFLLLAFCSVTAEEKLFYT
jgi:hypothetical protein